MVLQGSPPISLSDLRGEFGGTAPDSLSEYYRGGGLVPDTAANSGIPTSGQISLLDFLGGDASLALGTSPDQFNRTTFNQGKTLNTTFSNVSNFSIEIQVNKRYYIEGLIRSDVDSTSSPSRLSLQWTHPGLIVNQVGDYVTYIGVGEGSNSTFGTGATRYFWSNGVTGNPFPVDFPAYNSAGVTDQNAIVLWGTFEADNSGGSAWSGSPETGTLQLQFAQDTSTSNSNIIESNSYIAAWEI